MAISETQKVDYLWKKLAYGLSKTDTNANKRATNESIASPLLLRGSNVWAQSDLIPGVMPGSSSGVVTVYPTGSPDETTADTSATLNRTWKTGLIDWISPEFGSTYLVKVYIHTAGDAGNAAASGTQVFGAGSGNNDEWFFDYQSGILHFIGTNLPAGISGKSIYVSGARYTGIKGVAVPGDAASFTDLNITGVSTFSDTVHISSLTNNRIPIVGSGSTIEDDANLTFDGSTLAVGVDLDVDGRTELDITNISETLNVTGIATFANNIDANGDLDVDGRTELDITNISETLNVVGIATFTNNIDANGDLDVDGRTELDITNISETLNVVGIATFVNNIDANGDLDVDGHTELDDLRVSGVATFQSDVHLGDHDVLTIGTGDDLKIYHNGNNSFVSHIGDGDLNISGDDIIIASAGFENKAKFLTNGAVELFYDNSLKFQTTGIGVSVLSGTGLTATIAGPSNLILDPGVVGDNTGVVRIKGDLFVDGTQTQINSTTIELADFIVGIATTATSDLLSDGAGIQIGPNNTFLYEFNGGTNPSLKSSENLNVASGKVYQIDQTEVLSATTLGSSVVNSSLTNLGTLTSLSVSGDIDIDGRTELDITNISETLNVTGIATFADNIDANGDLDVDGHTELDHVNVSAASTFGGLIDINAGAQANTFKVEDLTSGRVVLAGTGGELEDSGNLTFNGTILALTGNQTVSGTIDIDGQAIFDDITVSAASTFTGNIDANGDLDVDGRTELDITNISETLNVTGITTFASNVDLNADLDVDGRTELDITNISETLNVVGVSTFAGNIDANGNLDVDGHTELDHVNVSAASTFAGLVDINAGAQVNTLKVEDLTDNRIVLAGTSGELEDSANLTFDGTTLALTGNQTVSGTIDIDGQAIFDDITVSAASTFTGNIDANGNLDVDGQTDLDVLNVAELATFSANIDADGDLDVDGRTELDITNISETLNVTGVSTFASNIDANGDLDVDGRTELDITNISETLNVVGIATFTNNIDANGDLDVDGRTELDITNISETLSVTGITTLSSDVNVGGALSVTGNSYFVGMVTFASGTDGNISIGDSTGDNVVFNAQIDSDLIPDDDGSYDLGSSTKEWQDLFIDGTANIDTLSADTASIGDLTDDRIVIAGSGGELEDDANLTFNGTTLSVGVDLDVDGRTELDITNISETLNVTGVSTFGNHIDANGNLDVDGQTDLDVLNVSDTATFTSNIDADGDLDVDGRTELDITNISETLNVVGITTFASNVDLNADLDVDGRTELDITNISETLNVTGVSTFGSNVDLNADLDVDGRTELDITNISETLNVTGIATFANNIDANGDLDVDGRTELDITNISETLNVTGVSTFGSNVDLNADLNISTDLDVDGRTELDITNISETLNVVGIATFANNIDANGNLDVDGQTDLDVLNVTDTATFTGLVDINNGGQANTFKVEDLTDNRVVIAGGSGELEDDANFTFDGTRLALGVGLTVTGVSTFAGNIDANGNLDVDGHTDLDDTIIAGFSTFSQLVDINANVTVSQDVTIDGSVGIATASPSTKLHVVGSTRLDDVIVSAASTFTGNIDANGDLDVEGRTELDITNISETLNVTGVSTFGSNMDLNANLDMSGDLDVDGRTELDITNISETLNVTGVSTFGSNMDLNADLDISGDLDVDGHTELDNVNISGVVTATAFHTGAEGSSIRVTSDTISGPAEIVIDPAAVGDNTGVLRIKGDLFVDGTQTQINSTTIEFADFIVGVATTATTNILADGAGIGIGTDKFFTFDNTNTAFKSTENLNLETGHTYKINGTDVLSATTLGSNVVNSSLTGIGSLTELSVGGVSTFTGNIDANGDLDVDGHTELDNLNVTGVSTFSGNLNLSGNITSNLTIVSTDAGSSAAPELDLFRNSESPADADYLGQIKFTGKQDGGGTVNYAKITGKILDASNTNEDGILEFMLRKAGANNIAARFRSDSLQLLNSTNLSVNGNTTLDGNLDVDGHTDLDHVIVSLASTFSDRVIFDSTNSIQIPVGTEGQKDAVGTAVTGQIRFNTTNAQFEGFGVGNNWGSLGGVKDVDGDTFITAEASAGNDDDVLSFHTAGSIRVAISSTGQVGIGSTIPAATLDVIGDTRLTGILTVTNGIDGIGIQSEGTSITTGIVTTINFVGSALSTITNTNGLVEVDIKSGTFTRSTTSFTATANQTTFSLTYTPNFIDVYHNGVRLTASEFTATNGSSVVLTEGAFAGDTIDIVVFENSALFGPGTRWSLVDTADQSGDIFRDTNVGIGTAIPTDAANSNNTKILNVGVVTANTLYGNLIGDITGNISGNAGGLTGTPDITVGTLNATTVSVAGTITYEDVSNVDSVGLVTARTGVRVTEGGLIVTAGVSTFTANIDANGDLDVDGHTDLDNLIVSGVSTFSSALDINAAANISGDLVIADKIVHDGDTNTTIRFPANDTITAETSGSERLRIFSGGQVAIATATNYAHANADDFIVGDRSNDESGITIGSANQGQIAFADSGDNRAGLIHYQHTDDSMRFMTAGAGNERLRITSAGNIGINSLVPVARVDLEGTLGLETTITTVSSTSATTIDTLPIATYRSAKFQIQVTQGSSYQTADLLVIHDGSIASSIEYASLSTSEELAVFTTEISGSNLLLKATMGSASSATVKVVRYGVTI